MGESKERWKRKEGEGEEEDEGEGGKGVKGRDRGEKRGVKGEGRVGKRGVKGEGRVGKRSVKGEGRGGKRSVKGEGRGGKRGVKRGAKERIKRIGSQNLDYQILFLAHHCCPCVWPSSWGAPVHMAARLKWLEPPRILAPANQLAQHSRGVSGIFRSHASSGTTCSLFWHLGCNQAIS